MVSPERNGHFINKGRGRGVCDLGGEGARGWPPPPLLLSCVRSSLTWWRASQTAQRPCHPVGGAGGRENRHRADHSSSAVPMRLPAAIPECTSGIVADLSECSAPVQC